MGPISNRRVEELRDALQRYGVTYLFIGETGAILHGFPDTTQDADLYVQKTLRNGIRYTSGRPLDPSGSWQTRRPDRGGRASLG